MAYESNRDRVDDELKRILFATVADAAAAIVEESVLLMDNSPRGGRTYRRGGVTHKASAPGEPPAPDTGRLKQSAKSTAAYQSGFEIRASATWSTKYAPMLEFGTVKMEPRPFARPAVKNREKEIAAMFNGLKTELRRK